MLDIFETFMRNLHLFWLLATICGKVRVSNFFFCWTKVVNCVKRILFTSGKFLPPAVHILIYFIYIVYILE